MTTFVTLPDEQDGIDVDAALLALEDAHTDLDGTLGVRALLLRLASIDRERDRTKELAAAVTHPYVAKLSRLDGEEARIRQSLTAYLRTTKDGKVQVPDAGTAYLSQRKPRVDVTDEAALLAWWKNDAGRTVPMTDPQPKPDLTAIKARIIEDLESTGEVPPAGVGVTVVAAEKHVSVRTA